MSNNNNRDNRDFLNRDRFENTNLHVDKNVKHERDLREARENAEAMKQTLTWLIPLLLLLAIGYYLYRRAYTTQVTPVRPVAVATTPITETKALETTPVATADVK